MSRPKKFHRYLVPIPTEGNRIEAVEVSGFWPITESQWAQLELVLGLFKAGLVVPDPIESEQAADS